MRARLRSARSLIDARDLVASGTPMTTSGTDPWEATAARHHPRRAPLANRVLPGAHAPCARDVVGGGLGRADAAGWVGCRRRVEPHARCGHSVSALPRSIAARSVTVWLADDSCITTCSAMTFGGTKGQSVPNRTLSRPATLLSAVVVDGSQAIALSYQNRLR